MLKIERYRKTRFWGLYEDGELLCVTVYKKGARAVMERLEGKVGPTLVADPRSHALAPRIDVTPT